MDIGIIKQAKKQCESEIRSIIAMFEHQTGLTVDQIDIDRQFQCLELKNEITITMNVRLI